MKAPILTKNSGNIQFLLNGLAGFRSTQAEPVNVDASSPPVTIEELDILHTPGADRSASIAFITDYVPGAFLLHDHLHVRGGHQVSWLVDGVPVPNTNLSSNVGRQLDPKDIENVEVSRGGYSAKYGDRTYGMVNIVPRSASPSVKTCPSRFPH